MNRVLAAAVFVVLFSEGLLLAQGYGGVGFPGGGGHGVGALANFFLPLTGGTVTGQVVFSGVTTDISTAGAEDLTLAPGGAGKVIVGGGFDTRGTFTNGGSTACSNFAGSGHHCINNDNVFQYDSVAGGVLAVIQNTNAAGYAGYTIQDGAGSGQKMLLAWAGASWGDADLASKTFLQTNAVKIGMHRFDDVAAGTDGWDWVDNTTGTGVRQFAIEGNGAVRFRDMTSANGSTCNSSNEGLLYYRSISGSNKSGFCVCAETSSGAYAWKMGMTFGSSALTDGDC